MRIVVFSDTHGNYSAMHKVFKRNGNADLFIFLGDGERDLERLSSQYLDKKVLHVSGNCDFASMTPNNDIYITPSGVKIFFTHGHKWAVKYTTDKLFEHAKAIGAQIVLYGHTHCRNYEFRDGVHILNPGSAGCPRDFLPACYAYIDITDAGIFCAHVDL
ncbi:MAG: YfcE family phosphodiesterase [Ruminococcus sp.]|nr:YfcE family phosphodiesterase [Ruminococcus sp.]